MTDLGVNPTRLIPYPGITDLGVKPVKVIAYPGNADSVHFDFNTRLQFRGTDYKVFGNDIRFVKRETDTEMLAGIIVRLMGNHPISVIDVKPYGLQVHYNRTGVLADIVADVAAAASDGHDIEFVDETKD